MAERQWTVYYNSWLPAHKEPYGAVQAGSSVAFQLNGGSLPITSVTLRIHKDFGSFYEQEMERNEQDNTFRTTFHLAEGNGLYYYAFQIVHNGDGEEEVMYYGNNEEMLGGEGKLYYEAEDIRPYQLTAYSFEDPSPEWYRFGTAYHIFVDRFYNGTEDGSVLNPKKNSFIYSSPYDTPQYIKNEAGEIIRWEFYGGNLKGIIKKLPYLEEMGITILYLSPIFEARSNHKYDTGNYFKVDPMFGDEDDFQELLLEARERGMRVMLDGVFNHVGADSLYFNRFGNYEETGAYQSMDSPYSDWFTFNSYPDEYEAWWGVKDLPTLNTEHPAVQEFIYKSPDSVVQYWTSKGIGGWRLDVADELSDDFLYGLRQAVEESAVEKSVVIGEIWEDATNKIAYEKRRHYLEGGMLHGAMNYPFRDIILDLLNGRITVQKAVMRWLNLKENYPPAAFYSNLNNVGSHDTARIRTALQNSSEKVRLAFLLLFVLPGVPCVYYGDEAGLEGSTDPDNRRTYPWGREDQSLVEYVKQLIHWRREEDVLAEGSFYPFASADVLGILRTQEDGSAVVALLNPTAEEKTLQSEHIKDIIDFDISTFLQENEIDDLPLQPLSFRLFAVNASGEVTEQTERVQEEVAYRE